MKMSTRLPAAGWCTALFVAGCAAGAVPPATSQAGATGATQPGATSPPGATSQPTSQASGLISGTWTGTVSRHYTESTTTASDSDSTLLVVTYDATIKISSTVVDVNSWTLNGPATIKATQSSDYKAHFTSTLGNCDKHYHDEDIADGTGVVDGGLSIADDATYEFTISIPGLDNGMESAMRDETGCLGAVNTETNPWPVASVDLQGSGDVTDPTFLSGTTSRPIANGGQDVVTWNLRLTP